MTLRRRSVLLASLVGLILSLSPGATAAQEPSAVSVVVAKARELTELVNPYEGLLAANLVGWEAAASKSLELDPSMRNIEARYPGAAKAGLDAARPLAREYVTKFVGKARDRKAELFAQRMTESEIDEAIRFFSTPTGKKVIRQLLRNADPAGIGEDYATRRAQEGKAELSAADAVRIEEKAALKTVTQLSAYETVALLRFTRTRAAAKLRAATAEAEVEILRMANNPDPDWIAKQKDLMSSAILAFVEARQKI